MIQRLSSYNQPAMVWFRQDLRLGDNPALTQALADHTIVIPVYIWSPEEEGNWPYGGASRWWLHQSLQSLTHSLQKKGSRLIIRKGSLWNELERLIKETKSVALYWNQRYEPEVRKQDGEILNKLKQSGITVNTFNGSLLYSPSKVLKEDGTPYKVFTPYWRKCLSLPEPETPLPIPVTLTKVPDQIISLDLDALALEPKTHWDAGLKRAWKAGEAEAQNQLKAFLHHHLVDYPVNRDIPGTDGTSRLSAYLHFGEISPHQVWHECKKYEFKKKAPGTIKASEVYLRELGWREFGYQLLYHFPHTPEQPLDEKYSKFPWIKDYSLLKKWQQGLTGYPIVDAGMRQLWQTGWMHNRVRMIVSSFLVKDLLLPWGLGAQWFWDTLVDADLASNTMGWQWSAGCGADAAPYFRIFNPILQGKKFDPEGHYIRAYIPELTLLPNMYIHEPWTASSVMLKDSKVIMGQTYPFPIVDHAYARERALAALSQMKKK